MEDTIEKTRVKNKQIDLLKKVPIWLKEDENFKKEFMDVIYRKQAQETVQKINSDFLKTQETAPLKI